MRQKITMTNFRSAGRAAFLFTLSTAAFSHAWAQTAPTTVPPRKAVPPKAAPVKTEPVKATPFKSDKTGEQILDGYVAASGGKEAYAKITSTQSKADLAIPAQGIKGTVEVYAKAPNKLLTIQTIENLGTFQVGFDGTTGWAKDPLQGLRVLSGVELEQLKREANFNSAVDWRSVYKKPEVIGMEKVNGKDAYVVRLIPLQGKPLPKTQYFDKETLLLVREDSIAESPQGTASIQAYPSDYRTVDGIKIAFGGRAKAGPAEFTSTITEVKNNVPLDDSKFTKPAN